MSDTTTTPQRRGRPATGTALSATERSRRLHERAGRVYETAFHPGRPLADVADSVLLLALADEYRRIRKGQTGETLLIRYIRELLLRAGVESTALSSLDAHYSIDPAVNPVESTDNDSVETTTIQTPLTVESTDSQTDGITVDSTDNPEPFTLAPAEPTEPVPDRETILARIRQMSDQGITSDKIAAALNAEGIPTFRGRGSWQGGTIRRLLQAQNHDQRSA